MKEPIFLSARRMMRACNTAHSTEIFMDINFSPEDECIQFDILVSEMEHVTQLCGLLNLTLHIEANSNPESDKTLDFYIN